MININLFGTALIVLMLIPNAVFALKNKGKGFDVPNKLVGTAEQLGRFGSMLFMIVNIDALYGFTSDESFAVWLIASAVIMLLYYIFWVLYFIRPRAFFAIMLAVLPSILFIFSGIMPRYIPLIVTGVIFAPMHIYITVKSQKKDN